MSQADLRRRMRGSDAMFLYFERKEMPLHIGCVAVLDGPFDKEGERLLASRMPEIPRYRQRVIFTPMNVTHPTWEDDPDFDVNNHIRHVTLDPPGTDAQLADLSGKIFTTLMDRSRPLWDITVVDGLEDGRSAIICRVHHCMVDGVSGVALVNVLFDTTKTPRKVEPQPWNPPPLPTPQEALVDGLSGMWADAAERVIGAQLTIMRLAQAFIGDSAKTSTKALLATIPELLRPTEKLPFNRPCSGVRGHCWTKTLFGEARAIRAALGGTINDVVMTVVTGAVMRYVNAHREPLTGRFLRMMVPVNLRSEDPQGRTGNEISMIPLSVPLDIAEPEHRFREIAKRSAAMKAARIADVIQLIGTGIGWTPPTVQQSLAAMPFMPQPVPIVNMVCTNVPGPMIPLYANGRELLTYYPHVPCGSDVGISIAISSYNQHLFFGVTYDMQAAPDGELFRDFLVEAYTELRESAGVRPMTPAARAPIRADAPAADIRAHRAEASPIRAKAAAAAAEAERKGVSANEAPVAESVASVADSAVESAVPPVFATTEAPPVAGSDTVSLQGADGQVAADQLGKPRKRPRPSAVRRAKTSTAEAPHATTPPAPASVQPAPKAAAKKTARGKAHRGPKAKTRKGAQATARSR